MSQSQRRIMVALLHALVAVPAQLQRDTRTRSGVLGSGAIEFTMPLVMAPFHGGNVQVSAYGSGSNYCKVRGWYRQGNVDLNIDVYCFNRSGQAADARFTGLYHDAELSGTGRAFA